MNGPGINGSILTEIDQKPFICQQKVEQRNEEFRLVRPLPEVRPGEAREFQEAGQLLFQIHKPRQPFEGDRRGLICGQSECHRQGSVKTSNLILSAPGPKCVRATIGREAALESQAMDAKTKTVLIVEDNELNMKLFHDLLDAHGYQILQTKDGMEALDIAREHHPDLILMDIQLPEVSGLEVTKWLKEDDSLKSIPVVAVTAFAMKGDEEVIRQGGCEAYISKPISVTSFLETVRRFIG